jgi:hypothetical protein
VITAFWKTCVFRPKREYCKLNSDVHINFLSSISLAIQTKYLQRTTGVRPNISNNIQATSIKDCIYGYTLGAGLDNMKRDVFGKFRLSVRSKLYIYRYGTTGTNFVTSLAIPYSGARIG